jgi:hypothetical protein
MESNLGGLSRKSKNFTLSTPTNSKPKPAKRKMTSSSMTSTKMSLTNQTLDLTLDLMPNLKVAIKSLSIRKK